MIRYAEKHSQEEVEKLLDPIVLEWFKSRYRKFSPPQVDAIYHIHNKENVLVSSPTGTGKTFAAFLDILSQLIQLYKNGNSERGVKVLYVSPLKALINDIRKNLLVPLEEMKSGKEREWLSGISVGIRTSDSTSSEKAKQLLKPPSILCTTPESLAIAVTAPKFRENLRTVRWVIVDEIHALAESKRGSYLSLTLELLQELAEFQRIGLSATTAPIEEIARFLVGSNRDVTIIDARFEKKTEIKVLSPVKDIVKASETKLTESTYSLLYSLLKKSKTALIFTNTRSGTERVVANLKKKFPDIFTDETIGAHHSSVSRDLRLDFEDKLKNGQLKAIVSSTSLELGIDIGYIDLVIQLGSPKSIIRLLQRVGRSGHSINSTSKGVIIASDNDDIVETSVMAYFALRRELDKIKIIKNPLDVLSQIIVSMSLVKRWKVAEAYSLVKRSYSFESLEWNDFIDVINYLAGAYHSLEERGVYAKISLYKNGERADSLGYEDEDAEFGRRKSARMIFYLNQGTIPDETKIVVFEGKKPIGTLEEEFVERLAPGDRFVLAGKIYEFLSSKRMKVYVKRAEDSKPTVPAWFSEELPLSYDLANRIQAFRSSLIGLSKKDVLKRIKDYPADENAKNAIAEYITLMSEFLKSRKIEKLSPSDYLVEQYESEKMNIVFHTLLGRKANDALSRAYGYKLSQMLGSSVGVMVSDNGFVLSVERDAEVNAKKLLRSVTSENIEGILLKAIANTELFRRKFRQVAARSFMILRNYKGHAISVGKQQFNSDLLVKVVQNVDNFPLLKEAYREILQDYMDISAAKEFLSRIESGEYRYMVLDRSNVPSPFSFKMLAWGSSDVILMEDRRKLILKLHQKLLQFLQKKREDADI
ncbi:MAG: ATP-dependent helicase [Nitrososphaeria archaeon]|nr:ATP-dependent helicase [Conexivisphaerales archaeon]